MAIGEGGSGVLTLTTGVSCMGSCCAILYGGAQKTKRRENLNCKQPAHMKQQSVSSAGNLSPSVSSGDRELLCIKAPCNCRSYTIMRHNPTLPNNNRRADAVYTAHCHAWPTKGPDKPLQVHDLLSDCSPTTWQQDLGSPSKGTPFTKNGAGLLGRSPAS